MDLRDDASTIEKLAKNKQKPVNSDEAEGLARELGAVKYMECSAATLVSDITKTCPCNILQFITAVEKDNFQMKNCDVAIIFAQTKDCGYTLEPPH